MAAISASMVKELRQRTGLGMLECKKALAETAALLVLRKKLNALWEDEEEES